MPLIFDLEAEFERLNGIWISGLKGFDERLAEDYKWLEQLRKNVLELIESEAKNKSHSDASLTTRNSQNSAEEIRNQSANVNLAENDVAGPSVEKQSLPLNSSKSSNANMEIADAASGVPVRSLRPRKAKGQKGNELPELEPIVKKRTCSNNKKVSNAETISSPPPLPRSIPSRTPEMPILKIQFPLDPVVVISPMKPQRPAKPPRTNTPLRPVMVLAESHSTNGIHTSKASLVLSTENAPKLIPRVTCSPLKMPNKKSSKSSRGSKKRKSSTKKTSLRRKSSKKGNGSSSSVQNLVTRTSSLESMRKSSGEKRSRASMEVVQIEESLRSSLEDNMAKKNEEDPDSPPTKKLKNLPTKVDLINGGSAVIIRAHAETSGHFQKTTDKSSVRTRPNGIIDHSRDNSSDTSVISESPSPKCPRSKIIRTKVAQVASEKPVRGRIQYSLRSRAISSSVTPASSSESIKSNKFVKSTLKRSSSCSALGSQTNFNNSLLSRNCMKPMTPAEKQEKRRNELKEKEQKQEDVLKKREAEIKRKIEERKKKREERMQKVHAARELQHQETLKKLHEEQIRVKQLEEMNHKLAMAQKLEKEKAQKEEEDRRYEAFLEQKRMQRLLRQQKAEEKRMEIEKEKLEQKRIARAKEEMIRIQKEREEMIRIQKEKATTVTNTPNKQMNVTVTLDGKDSSVYDITLNKPQTKYLEPSSNADDYGINHLDSEESTDDEAKPKKKIPRWASGIEFRRLLLEQINKNINVGDIFPQDELLQMPDLTEIFGKKRKGYKTRTSSAQWDSPAPSLD